ncbi:MAG: HAD-IIB family hydrolase [Oscillospiraceae bacterium]|nr:HAD-IIB family hydrolase [Oscillospiraceae bacterium]
MGKFDGVLLASDYDGTFGDGCDIHPHNLKMVDYFKREGGRFTIATGRAHHTFRAVRPLIPFNAPVLLANGAMIYDFEQGKALFERKLPPEAPADMALLAQLFPKMSLEAYCGEDDIYAWNPNLYVRHHLNYTQCTAHMCSIPEMPYPWDKAILENGHKTLVKLQDEILTRWGERYEAFFSAEHMLELNPKGCTKGDAVLRLAEMLNIKRENVYCVGDNQNDLSMLEVSATPFAPANAIPMVKNLPGLVLLPPCKKGAVGALIERLDAIY